MLKTLDDEFARYLASYLKEHEDEFLETGWGGTYVLTDQLYELIKQFRQELP